MLKVGDKVLCIKDVVYFTELRYEKNHIYSITKIDSRYYYLGQNMAFSIKFESYYPGDYFGNYFISLKEDRNKKLENLLKCLK